VLSGSQSLELKSFLQKAEKADSVSFLAIPGMESHAPASGAIFGILKQMKEEFEVNLADMQASEAKSLSEYEGLKAAKEDEMAVGKQQVEDADEALASFMEKHAEAAEQVADTTEQLDNDTIFLATLTKQCVAVDADYALRVKGRLEEIGAVQDTIGFLNSDEAHAMFEKTVNSASFMQTQSVTVTVGRTVSATELKEKWTRKKLVDMLQTAAAKSSSIRLVMLVTSARLDAFTKVKAEIDKMIAELKKQSADEIKKRDYCIAELDKTNRTMEAKYDLQAKIESTIADLESSIDSFKKGIAEKTGEIADMQTAMKRGSEDREAENADYQQTVSDQQVTQMILAKALERMKATYAFLQGAPQTQLSATKTDPGSAPARFAEGGQNSGGAKVIGMIQGVIDDSKKTEAEAIAAEQDGQTAYENFMKASNKSITEASKAINNMSEELAKSQEEHVLTKEGLAAVNQELSDLHDTDMSLHKDCDFLLQNFDVRQAARADEVDSMNEAKNILSGAK